MTLKVKLDPAKVAEVKRMLSGVKNAAPRVLVRTINKTITSGKGYAAKEVVKHYNLTEKRVRADNKGSINANLGKISGKIDHTGVPVSLTTFKGTRQVKDGVSVQIKKNKDRWVWRHGFIRTVRNAKQAFYRPTPVRGSRLYKVWKRSDKYGVLPRMYRYGPKDVIYRLTGPRVEDELGKKRTIDPVQAKIDERSQAVMDQELTFELSKL
jgi:hypothetical protein